MMASPRSSQLRCEGSSHRTSSQRLTLGHEHEAVGCLSRGGPDLLDIGEWDGARPHLECAMGNGGRGGRKLLDEIGARGGAKTNRNRFEPPRAGALRRDRPPAAA